LGRHAISDWQRVFNQLGVTAPIGKGGSLYAAHKGEEGLLRRILTRIDCASGIAPSPLPLEEIQALCPDLNPSLSFMAHVSGEGHVDVPRTLNALRSHFESSGKIRYSAKVQEIQPQQIILEGETVPSDLVVDCRGLGAKDAFANLRGVRGEAVLVRAPEVNIPLSMRIVHPRSALYIIPRADHHYYLGATSIESEDRGPVRVRSVLELLSQAYAVHSGFKEATIEELVVGVRPALPDHLPKFSVQPGLIRFNGFYRHGFLLGPALCHKVLARYLEDTPNPELDRFELGSSS
jgi:glycine oxidase